MKYLNNLNIVTTNPNFTIVLPVGCGAKCSFCSWRNSEQDRQDFDDTFVEKLPEILESLPSQCNQITISGGEPSKYKRLSEVMYILNYHKKKNIKKIVFTTNGKNLLNLVKESWFVDTVDYVNISRHHFKQSFNDSIMGVKLLTWEEIKLASDALAKHGIATNINCVLSKNIQNPYGLEYDEKFVEEFVSIAKAHNVNSITLRKDYDDGFEKHELENLLKRKPKDISECPVCGKSRYLVDGMDVLFSTSEFEPSDILGTDRVYEFILQPNGNLTTDWEGEEIVLLKPLTNKTASATVDKIVSITQMIQNKTDKTFNGCGIQIGGCY